MRADMQKNGFGLSKTICRKISRTPEDSPSYVKEFKNIHFYNIFDRNY